MREISFFIFGMLICKDCLTISAPTSPLTWKTWVETTSVGRVREMAFLAFLSNHPILGNSLTAVEGMMVVKSPLIRLNKALFLWGNVALGVGTGVPLDFHAYFEQSLHFYDEENHFVVEVEGDSYFQSHAQN